MRVHPCIPGMVLLVLGIALSPELRADTTTYSGTLSADNSVVNIALTVTSPEEFTFATTSYAAGGFVPYLTLFSSSGTPLGFNGASGMCSGSAVADTSTGMCNDAYLSLMLSAGTYDLALTEFPNVALGRKSDGFLFASDPNATGTLCGISGGKFLETDVPTCVQRTNKYTLDVTTANPVPEPPTLLLMLTPLALLGAGACRRAI